MKTEIEKLKVDVEKLQQRIAELEKPQELTRETGMPKLNERRYWIDCAGEVLGTNSEIGNDYEYFESFNSIHEAKTERDYTLASRRVRAWAKAVNGDWKADWEKSERKWGVHIYQGKLEVDVCVGTNMNIHQICFPTEELATKFLELFRPELKILSNP